MEKQDFVEKCSKFFKDKKIREMFVNQIELFYAIKGNGRVGNHYKIGDRVVLEKGQFIHGTRLTPKDYHYVADCGIVSADFFLDRPQKDVKKNFVSEFWVVNENLGLDEWLNKYCGVTINLLGRGNEKFEPVICPLNEIESEIKKLKNKNCDIVDIVQNMEARYLPCDSWGVGCTIAFILRPNGEESERLFAVNLIDRRFDKNIQKKIFPKWYFEKYLETGLYDAHENDRETAIMFGVPQELIEGVIVNREIEKNKSELKQIKEIFGDVYVCTIDGKVIM